MARYYYRDKWFTMNELAHISGLNADTIRARIRRGYSLENALQSSLIHDSLEGFCEASYWEDWLGMPMGELHIIYWKWCVSNGYAPLPKNTFSKQLLSCYPNLKVVPNRGSRVIRERRVE